MNSQIAPLAYFDVNEEIRTAAQAAANMAREAADAAKDEITRKLAVAVYSLARAVEGFAGNPQEKMVSERDKPDVPEAGGSPERLANPKK